MIRRDKLVFGFFLCLALAGGSWWGARTWLERTIVVPAYGGTLREAFIGTPRNINPVLADATESESAIETMVFSSLFKADTEGNLVPDLAESYTISENRREYFITLRQNAKWHDSAPVSADDVLFTLSLIQSPTLRSPLSFAWHGIETKKISESTIKFALPEPYEYFFQNLTFRIMPRHLWERVPLENFHLAELNLQPIGSGPYRFKSFERDKYGNITSYLLSYNSEHFRKRPYINTIQLNFYRTKEDALVAWRRGEVDFVGGVEIADMVNAKQANIKQIPTLRQFNVFFNTNATLLRDKNVRQALLTAINREVFVTEILGTKGRVIDVASVYNPEMARELLARARWANPDENGILTRGAGRNRIPLKLKMVIPAGAIHQATAEFLVRSWREIGADVQILNLDAAGISKAIMERDYDILLFGTLLTTEPDLFPFWHSTQIDHPGLNLSRLNIRPLDTILERSRREAMPEERQSLRSQAIGLIQNAHAALFLYSPYYFYAVSPRISWGEASPKIIGAPEERFNRIEEWFINTKRIWQR